MPRAQLTKPFSLAHSAVRGPRRRSLSMATVWPGSPSPTVRWTPKQARSRAGAASQQRVAAVGAALRPWPGLRPLSSRPRPRGPPVPKQAQPERRRERKLDADKVGLDYALTGTKLWHGAKVWTLFLGQMKARLDFPHGGTDGMGHWKPRGAPLILHLVLLQILSPDLLLPRGIPGILSCHTARTPQGLRCHWP